MQRFEEKEISSKKIFEGKLLGLRVDNVELPTGEETTREVVEHPGAVAVIAITPEDELVLVRQFRRPTGEVTLEIPAGVPKRGEKGEETARRELEEETGYRAKKIVKVWEGYASPGYSTELIRYYLATDMDLVRQKPDEDELLEVELVDIELCGELIRSGTVKDNKTFVGIMLAKENLVEGSD